MLQDPLVRTAAHGQRVLDAQPIVGLAKTAEGQQLLAIPIVLKGVWLAHPLVDDVRIGEQGMIRQMVPSLAGDGESQ